MSSKSTTLPDVIDMMPTKRGYQKAEPLKYPAVRKIKILTIHLRRRLAPRQMNITSNNEVRAKEVSEGMFTNHFKRKLLKDSAEAVGICSHCTVGAWAYVRVGARTYTVVLKFPKGGIKELGYVQDCY